VKRKAETGVIPKMPAKQQKLGKRHERVPLIALRKNQGLELDPEL
jgi:hypothetical protein